MSPLLAAIVAGAVTANIADVPQRIRPGLQFCSKRLLRVGIALLGLQVTFAEILGLGPATLVVVFVVVTAATGRAAPLVPLFVLAFLGCAAIRSTGGIPSAALDLAGFLQTALFTAAMFALGTGVRLRALARVGARPLVLAAASTLWVAALALAGALVAT
ncbi:putative sulfate exporter family transporter [Nocardia fusca]|uniref:putative sulfate exporter family transporter n=1 Tax=Nocardia fusca TaxID=941183 RepID=UPI0037CB31C6